MKAVIIAAGLGSRLGQVTEDRPKCLITVGKRTILDHQLRALSENDVTDVHLVTGHCKKAFAGMKLPTFFNEDFRNNNILASMMYADSIFDDGFIASYSDILYSPAVVSKLMSSEADISVVVDCDWQEKYEGRTEHPLSEAELTSYDSSYRALKLGKDLQFEPNQTIGEFIGLFRFSSHGALLLKRFHAQAKQQFDGRPFINAKDFKKAYITDMMMYLIEHDVPIHCIPISKQWYEIDTEQDLENARVWLQSESWT